jgi:2-oxoglutarate dehydrogenase E1 component
VRFSQVGLAASPVTRYRKGGSPMHREPRDFGVNVGLVEELHAKYLDNPESVDASWRRFFEDGFEDSPAPSPAPRAANGGNGNGGNGNAHGAANRHTPNGDDEMVLRLAEAFAKTWAEPTLPHDETEMLARAAMQGRVFQLVNAYRVRGHLFAHVDPLGVPPTAPPELDLRNFELGPEHLDRAFAAVDLAGPNVQTLRDIIARLEETYCRSIGVEFTHIEDPVQRKWLQSRMESTRNRLALDPDLQRRILEKLTDAEIFEQFVHKSYEAGTKRFSLEGAESLIPLLDVLVERGGARGVEEVVIGMAHRGRLNVLANVLEKSLREIFAAFEDQDAEAYLGSGDVKYHLGYSTDRKTQDGHEVHLTLTFNPSHLEFVDPVVLGRTRAKQDRVGGRRDRVMPLLIHGDAAFIGQGVVSESLNLMHLPGYTTGGTIHVIVNNQVGFTTDVSDSRSTRYATDITRMLKVPVFHVNGEDPEAVVQVAYLAIDYRQRFGTDVVIDMYCYRRHGHNEGDEPRYTQPLMYQHIDKKPTVRQVYVKRLEEMGELKVEEADSIALRRRQHLAEVLDDVRKKGFAPVAHAMGGLWAPYKGGKDADVPEVETRVPAEQLIALSQRLLEVPEGFTVHPKLVPLLKARHDRLLAGEFDWAVGETMAYATLLAEGTSVRLSGQDVGRGTFSHRHAVLSDVKSGALLTPLSSVAKEGARCTIYNSPLSEQGVLGFEFGYALDWPDGLVIWEAQFGDFLNGAQVIVDQFITSSEDKWLRLSGLVLYLPHGYEGQGPEHSSARLERFLTNAAEDNIQVCNVTTPAQLFHLLRRQVLRPWRKPLVIMTPKSLLRVGTTAKGARAVSTLKDLSEGRFQRVIPDQTLTAPEDVKRILLCSGKVYYDLVAMRDARNANDVAIIRVEQLYPINEELTDTLAPYKSGTKVVWVQEEPRNYGAAYHMLVNLPAMLGDRFPVSCVARAPSASPATGSKASHLLEQRRLLEEAFADR